MYLEKRRSVKECLAPLVNLQEGHWTVVDSDGTPIMDLRGEDLHSFSEVYVYLVGRQNHEIKAPDEFRQFLRSLRITYFSPFNLRSPEIFTAYRTIKLRTFAQSTIVRGRILHGLEPEGRLWLIWGGDEVKMLDITRTDSAPESIALPENLEPHGLVVGQGKVIVYGSGAAHCVCSNSVGDTIRWEIFYSPRDDSEILKVGHERDIYFVIVRESNVLKAYTGKANDWQDRAQNALVYDPNLQSAVFSAGKLLWVDHTGTIRGRDSQVALPMPREDHSPIDFEAVSAGGLVLMRGNRIYFISKDMEVKFHISIARAVDISLSKNLLSVLTEDNLLHLFVLDPEIFPGSWGLYEEIPFSTEEVSESDSSTGISDSSVDGFPDSGTGQDQGISIAVNEDRPIIFADLEFPIISTGPILQKAREITKGCSKDEDKARKIFDWMQENIKYDEHYSYTLFRYRNSLRVFEEGHGVCGEMAYLYVALARPVNLDARYCHIDVDYRGEKVNHACAVVLIGEGEGNEKRPILVDPAYHKFDVKHKEYEILEDDELYDRSDVKAGLQTRINNLRLGSKGLMFDTRQSLSMETIMSRPTVIEMADIGNDEEKAFLMGLLFFRIYEYHESRREPFRGDEKLIHLTLIEEAHRLLPNVGTETHEESSNIKGKAVETVIDMLSEIRAYGEGIIIAEQIPSKLAPDVIKNTSLKIMHRLPPRDDREMVGATMNMGKEKAEFAASLKVGEALAYCEARGETFWIHAEKITLDGSTSYEEMEKQIRLTYDRIFPNVHRYMTCCEACNLYKEQCRLIRGTATQLVDRHDFYKAAVKLIMTSIFAPGSIRPVADEIYQYIKPEAGTRLDDILWCAMAHAIERWSAGKGDTLSWSYEDQEEVSRKVSTLLANLITNHFQPTQEKNSVRFFVENLSNVGRSPYLGCEYCRSGCLFQYEVMEFSKDQIYTEEISDIIHSAATNTIMYRELCNLAMDMSEQVIPGADKTMARDIALCFLVQRLNSFRVSFLRKRQHLKALVKLLGVDDDKKKEQ